jgi:hypothetical protein
LVPASLPPKAPLDLGELFRSLRSQADYALGRLEGAVLTLPKPDLFVFMYVREEAVFFCQIEGTQSSLPNLLAAEARLHDPDAPADVSEVINDVRAMNQGLKRLAGLPVSVRLVGEIHAALLRGVAEVAAEAAQTLAAVLRMGEEYRNRITACPGRAAFSGHRPMEKLFDHPIVTVGTVRKWLDVTPASANNPVHRLVEAGVLRETVGDARNRRFRFDPYLRVFEEPGDGGRRVLGMRYVGQAAGRDRPATTRPMRLAWHGQCVRLERGEPDATIFRPATNPGGWPAAIGQRRLAGSAERQTCCVSDEESTPMNDQSHLAAGDVVSGLEASELVEIQRVAPFGGKTLVEGVGLQSRRIVKRPLAAEEIAALVKVRGRQPTFDGDAQLFLLGAEAERIRIAHQFDPLFAVNASIVDPLPHQVEAVYRYLLPLPRIRFLLADDTGAGKTIMTGLLIKELLFRGVLQKVLIITPGGLTKQWKEEELQEKFGLYSRLVNRASFEAEPGQFSRYEEGIFVTSIDFLARNEGCLKAASETQWDLMVVDEAHKLSAYEYGTKLEESERYKAVKALAHKTDHLLFLTATPHRGRKDTFRRLLLLLDEDLFQKDEHVADRVREQAAPYLPAASPAAQAGGTSGEEDFEDERPISKARNRFFLRRLKEELVDWDNRPLFKDRHTKTIGYDLTPEEKTLYDEVTSYVRSKRKEAKAKRNRNVELTLMVMQRRLASSLYAITRTLENRLRALNEVLSILRDPSRSEAEKKRLFRGTSDPSDPRDITEYEDLTEEERERIDQRIFRQVLTDDPDKVEEERDEVERLFRLADSLKHHKEAKFAELLAVLDSSDVIRAEDEKLLIFTEHRDTLESLAKRLEEKGYTVARSMAAWMSTPASRPSDSSGRAPRSWWLPTRRAKASTSSSAATSSTGTSRGTRTGSNSGWGAYTGTVRPTMSSFKRGAYEMARSVNISTQLG